MSGRINCNKEYTCPNCNEKFRLKAGLFNHSCSRTGKVHSSNIYYKGRNNAKGKNNSA